MGLPVRLQALYWGIAAAVFFLALWGMGSVLLPFLVGGAIAYFLDPIADRLQRAGLSRVAATALISLLAVFIFVLLALLILPMLSRQTRCPRKRHGRSRHRKWNKMTRKTRPAPERPKSSFGLYRFTVRSISPKRRISACLSSGTIASDCDRMTSRTTTPKSSRIGFWNSEFIIRLPSASLRAP